MREAVLDMRSVAVCCGFNNYSAGPLRTAVNDAVVLYSRLTASESFNALDGMKSELFSQPTSANAILEALTRAALSPVEMVWFSFSGHAIVTRDGELRLLLPDWRGDASEDVQRRYSIGAGEIENVLRARLGSKKFVVVLDTCYSGAFGDFGIGRDLVPAAEKQIASAGAVVISSCGRHQLAHDGRPGSGDRNGAFTDAVIKVLDDHAETGAPLSVLQLFQEAKDKLRNGQLPTLYVNGLTEDFLIVGKPGAAPRDGIATLSAEVPAALKNELSAFLKSVVQLRRRRRVGLAHAVRQLESLAAEFYRYGDDTFVVPGHNSNVAEAFDNARTCIVGCTTPAYIENWQHGGLELMGAIREFIARHGGRVIRFFFVPDDFENRVPGVLDVVRDHVEAGVLAVIVNVDSFGPALLQEVFKDPRPDDLSSLECTFVDGKTFLRTHFAANGELKVEVDQRPDRSHHEYKTQLRPFLSSSKGVLFGVDLRDDGVVLSPLQSEDIGELRQQLESDLGVAA
jgi:hypothetical protein